MHSPQTSTMVDARVGVPCGWWYALKPHVSCLQYGGITLNVPTTNKLVRFRYRTLFSFRFQTDTYSNLFIPRCTKSYPPQSLDTDTMAEMQYRRANKRAALVLQGNSLPYYQDLAQV